MPNLSRRKKLEALRAAIYLLSLEIEDSREKMNQFYSQGSLLHSPEVQEASKKFNQLSSQMIRFDKEYMRQKQELSDSRF